MQATSKLLDIARDRRKTLKKGKEKRNMRKSQTTITNMFFILLFYMEKFILLENVFEKTSFIL